MRHAVGFLVALLSTAALAGCSFTDPSTDDADGDATTPGDVAATTTAEPSFEEEITHARADAVDGGASERQLSQIAEISDQGSVSYEQAKDAALQTIECINDAGGSATFIELSPIHGVPVPGYSASGGTGNESADLATIDTCDRQESYWINYLYQVQPEARVSAAESEAMQLAARIACLEEAGGTAPAEPDWNSVSDAIQELPQPHRIQCMVAGPE